MVDSNYERSMFCRFAECLSDNLVYTSLSFLLHLFPSSLFIEVCMCVFFFREKYREKEVEKKRDLRQERERREELIPEKR